MIAGHEPHNLRPTLRMPRLLAKEHQERGHNIVLGPLTFRGILQEAGCAAKVADFGAASNPFWRSIPVHEDWGGAG